MPIAKPFVTEKVYEDSGIHLMARVLGHLGTPVTQDEFGSITLKVYDKTDPGTEVASATLDVSEVIFDTLQLDARWSQDMVGYNFRHPTLATQLPHGGKTYCFEYKFSPSDGAPFPIVFEVETVNLLSS